MIESVFSLSDHSRSERRTANSEQRTAFFLPSRMQKIDTIVFDLGGVLIDWNPDYVFNKIFSTEEELQWYCQRWLPFLTGQRYFYSDASGVIRYNNAAAATGTDSPLQ